MTEAAMDVDGGDAPQRQKASAVDANDAKKNQMWVEKYRPSKLSDVAAHKDIIDTIGRLTSQDRLPHLLLYGPPGTGKTSTILAVAKELYGPQFSQMTLELNASDDRGIDVVRNEISAFASTMRFGSNAGFKLIILDECDSMTKDAQFALRRIIEKYTKHTRFCLIGNYVSKVIPALQSRCTRFRFAPLGPAAVKDRVQFVVQRENLSITDDAVDAVTRLGAGDMRRTLNILQSSFLSKEGDGPIDANSVYATTGQPRPEDIEAIAGVLLNSNFKEAVAKVAAIKQERGLALADIVRLLVEYVFRLHMPQLARANLVSDMADVEYRLAYVTHERLQLMALVGAFAAAREAIVAAAK
uniref:AAA+ ATPase domain-containing protein n=1 Tax=Micromonas pusilla TaxID=38833 RepID=A0A7S0KHQ5_MICPS|mmetsp:Transcript_8758/g.35480  ORF Transcript_8758/g.35480 Transcript_8758/m.35480 type:complete len:356 (-) Transcript_8758:943-2010(-)